MNKTQQILKEREEEFDKEFPPFRGVGAQFPIFENTPNRNHIIQHHATTISLLLNSLKEEIEQMECPEKCSQGHIFEGYGGEDGTEENWGACPVCVKSSKYNPVIKKSDISTLLSETINSLK